ncbi:MBL fold metallo-hydrolase [Evansella cellulosilytica]|nr:MBL fold metallo-hydrolase [Evansella cellulosilytica]
MDKEMSYGSDYKFIPATSINSGVGVEVQPDIYCYTIQVVNMCVIGRQDDNEFVLVDAGMPESANRIIEMTEERFGKNSKPKAIILTHGHFDHVGAIIELVNHWNVPVYAHQLEIPYLTGQKSYPEPDPTVEGGAIAKLSSLFPNEAVNLGDHVQPLPNDGIVPALPEFHWVHTPGHTPGHVSLYRKKDHSLLVGDAFVTVKQEYLYKVFTQEFEISGPPRYLTTDWQAAWNSVKKLASLHPALAVTGHGPPASGELLTNSLEKLVNDFEHIAIPDHGKYVNKYKH